MGPSPHGARTLAAEGQNMMGIVDIFRRAAPGEIFWVCFRRVAPGEIFGCFPARSAGEQFFGCFPARSAGGNIWVFSGAQRRGKFISVFSRRAAPGKIFWVYFRRAAPGQFAKLAKKCKIVSKWITFPANPPCPECQPCTHACAHTPDESGTVGSWWQKSPKTMLSGGAG